MGVQSEISGHAGGANAGVKAHTAHTILSVAGSHRRHVAAHQPILHERDPAIGAFFIHSGWTCLHKTLPDGGRQILSFPIQNDLACVSNYLLSTSHVSFSSITEADISIIPFKALEQAIASDPAVAKLVLGLLAREEALIIEHATSIGRRSSLVRTVSLVLEFAFRLERNGIYAREGFPFPINQTYLADALGLTPIHLNRVLRRLREANLATLRMGRIVIHDFDALVELSAFDLNYII